MSIPEHRSEFDSLIDAQFVERLKAGDRSTWQAFLEAAYPLFHQAAREAFRYCGQRPGNYSQEEWQSQILATMEDFYLVFPRRFRSFLGLEAFVAYVKVTAYYLTQKRLREERSPKPSQDPETLESNPGPSSGQAADHELKLRLLRECIGELPAKYRPAISRYYLDESRPTHEELAQTLELSSETVSQHCQRGKRVLKDCLERKLRERGWDHD